MAERASNTPLTALARHVLSPAPVRFLALLALCGAYIQGGLAKVLDFTGALAEMAHFGLNPQAPFAVAVIVLELGASGLILSGRLRWLGALGLAGFTVLAAFLANRFWAMAPPERTMAANAFFEHLGLAGAFVLVAWYDLSHGASDGKNSRGRDL
ncbi:DoxX family protein [Xanthobacter sp. AM33]|uniref:DoxX family protein n=1 Tax=Xanthobacter sp. AM33 TaxID=3380644 RepID=UPI0039BFFEB3